jgi:UDP-N-acetylglucosamine diphosphorylase/glucosamine-1-phosphate N-acetyltransferase
MRLCMVEDFAVAALEPLTLTRPAFELWLGGKALGRRLREAVERNARGPISCGAVVRSHLAQVLREREPRLAVNEPGWLSRGPTLVANARWVPPARLDLPPSDGGWVGLCEGRPACVQVADAAAVGLELASVDAWFEEVASSLRHVDLGGEWIHRPWDLVARNAAFLERDLDEQGRDGRPGRAAEGLALVGPADRLFIHESARIDPYTVFDTTAGPIWVGAGAWIQPFTRLEGPCSIGPNTQLFRANIRGGVTIGPNCRIGGEVEAAIVHGHSNKYHEGFLGHSYVGEWVNLGAITSNSDLRNDYGEVHVPLQGDPIPTGMSKVGCFLGDHTRTGLGSMLNTGTSVGVMCNVLPAGPLLPKHVPSFTAVLHGRVATGFSLEQMFATARTVKGRRGQEFTPAEERLYCDLYEQTRLERERAFQKVEDRRQDARPLAAATR